MKRILIVCAIISSSINCSSQVLVQDSLALVALYNSTNGDNWNYNSNWFVEDSLVNNWAGIDVENQRVVHIYLINNNLNGDIPSEIGNLDSLSFLDLSHNSISSLPNSIGNLKVLEEVNLSFNNLTSLPAGIGGCTELKRLQLNINYIQGVPMEIGSLINLETLILGGNSITTLPLAVFDLLSLKFLNFAANEIDTIPSSLGNLINLENFQFFKNNLTYIPEEIGNCISLNYINGYENNINSLPLTLLYLPFVETLYLAHNSLTFDDIEPLVSINGFEYWDQDSIGVNIDTTVYIDSTFYMEIQTGGEFNNYQWKKNNVIIEGATNNYFELSNINLADSGIYNCEISNSVATGLTLQSRLIDLQVEIYTKIKKPIYETNAVSLSIFPNPAYDKISIKLDTESSLNELEIFLFNQYGKLIKKIGLETRKLLELNISSLNKGIYYIQLKNIENESITNIEKIIKL